MATLDPRSNTSVSPSDNQFLATLPAEEYAALQGALERVDLTLYQSLCEQNVEMKYVYFPVDCAVSKLCSTGNGRAAEIAVVGYEGVIGIGVFLGEGLTPVGAVVQSSGQAYRLPAHVANEVFMRGGAMQSLLLRYAQALMTQVAQTAACNANHTLEQQLCRWLLLSHDRLRTAQLVMPRAELGDRRGAWDEVVREAIDNLHERGLIQYQRGNNIAITDRAALEARSCGCYDIVRQEYDRLLPGTDD